MVGGIVLLLLVVIFKSYTRTFNPSSSFLNFFEFYSLSSCVLNRRYVYIMVHSGNAANSLIYMLPILALLFSEVVFLNFRIDLRVKCMKNKRKSEQVF